MMSSLSIVGFCQKKLAVIIVQSTIIIPKVKVSVVSLKSHQSAHEIGSSRLCGKNKVVWLET